MPLQCWIQLAFTAFEGHTERMNNHRNAVEKFLQEVHMHPDTVNMENTVDHMLEEMALGLNGKPSSLKMLPTYIETDTDIPLEKPTVVLDAGGTNLRVALVTFKEGKKPVIDDYSKHPMPGSRDSTVGREEFFDTLAALVEPLISGDSSIGFCFSYSTEIFPDRDGRLLHWSKEIKAPDVVGRMIGSDLKDALRNRGIQDVPDIVILNDTVATLLTGKLSNPTRPWGGYAGFILGTGTNTCYVESNSAIRKVPGLNPSGKQIINCETGNYAYPNRGEADLMLGRTTSDTNAYLLEKMLSGGYFGALATQSAKLAGSKGLFSTRAVHSLTEIGMFSTKDADNYCHNPADTRDNAIARIMKTHANESDRQRLWFLFDALLERAAKLSAANIAASILKGPSGSGPLEASCLTIDGTTYYWYYRFQQRVESHLRPCLSNKNKYYETVRVNDAPLIGAAVAALTN